MTKRRLLNKKTYEEILLLKKLLIGDDEYKYEISVQLNETDKESIVIDSYFKEKKLARIIGKDYTEISKRIIEYLDGF